MAKASLRSAPGAAACRSPRRRYNARPAVPDAHDDRLVARPCAQDLLDPALVRRLLRRRRATAASRCAPRGADGPAIALPEIVDAARAAGAQAAAAGALLRHPRRPPGQAAGRLRAGAGRLGLRRRLHRGLSDQGQPAPRRRRRAGVARGRRLRPRGRQQARADGGARAGAAGQPRHLQRLQGPRVHPPGADRPQARPADLHRDREALRAAAGARGSRGARREARPRRAHAPGLARRRQVAEQRRRQGQVRAVAAPGAGPVEQLRDGRHDRRAWTCCTSTWARRSPTCATSPTACARRCATSSSCRSSGANPLHGRRRRPGRRLRRHALAQLLLDQLRPRPVRVEHRAAAGRSLRGARAAAAAHDHRVRPRDDRAPRGAGRQRVRGRGARRRAGCRPRTTTSRR